MKNTICLKCANLIHSSNNWRKEKGKRYTCGILVPQKYLSELKDLNSCKYFKRFDFKPKNVFLFGADTLVGSQLYKNMFLLRDINMSGGFEHGPYEEYIDDVFNINPTDLLELIEKKQIDILVWTYSKDTWKENTLLNKNLVYICENLPIRTKFIFLSSAEGFNGEKGNYTTEDEFDKPWMKKVEDMVKSFPNSLLIRTGEQFGVNAFTENFDFNTSYLLSDLAINRERGFPTNTIKSYVNVEYLAKKIIRHIYDNTSGIIHIPGKTMTSYEFQKELAFILGKDPELIVKKDNAGRKKDYSLI